jgi:type IV pilus assembly protein PilB
MLRLMSQEIAVDPGPVEEAPAADPPGLTPPSQRGRSQRLIGEIVVDLGFATRASVDEAIAVSCAQGVPTGQILIDSGVLRQDQLARALAERFGVNYVDLSLFEVDMGAVQLLTAELAKRYEAVPVAFMPDGTVLLAMADPTNIVTVDEISMITGRKVTPAAAAKADLAALIGRLSHIDQTVVEVEAHEPEFDIEVGLKEGSEAEAPIIRLVHSVIAQAVDMGASDIHFDPGRGGMQVLFRIDGVLRPEATVPRSMCGGVVSRIKIMASLDIAERRVSQDGRLAVMIDDRRVDVRVVTLPLVNGEGAVMRVLDTGSVVRDLEALGLQGADRERFVAAVERPYGAVLVTGPTGSGKSTTLYAALGIVNDGQRSILTIEDPVESQIPGVKQMQVSEKAGMTFANGLRSMLRADPDVIMVGEIRDRATAEIAIQAALTGHLMLSTLHTRDAPSAITRLIDMGIEPFMVAGAVDCVVAQRLARTLCGHCKREARLPASSVTEYGLDHADVFEPSGCIRCGWTGYSGRVGLFEVMPMTEEICALALDRRGVGEIAAAAASLGVRSMREDGIEKVRRGLTSLAEVGRVTSSR